MPGVGREAEFKTLYPDVLNVILMLSGVSWSVRNSEARNMIETAFAILSEVIITKQPAEAGRSCFEPRLMPRLPGRQ